MKTYLCALFASASFSLSAATLELDDGIQILAINGQTISTAPSSTVTLASGAQVIALRYHDLFEYGFEQHEFVNSGVHIVKFDATANERYQLVLPDMNVEQARRFALQPKFSMHGSVPVQVEQWDQNQLLSKLFE
ncbi:DUF2057 domain-containing protein [Neiella marina]|uniref:DUF2057 domain-containing protein n=1 Tax=Neiella holothuriorum TaxID=2870530 RepID=A0ABS7EK56_9GAMM|nr:DUF2057 family protein [Neiella holothuriorum]MBW8192675.1 DUF2057 domain-containing protein [Neiella holothuriorum]